MNTMTPNPDPVEDAEIETPREEPSRPTKRPKRRPPKSAAMRLAGIEAEAKVLREMVEAHRLKLRAKLVDDLYGRCEIAPITGDLDESKRMAKLRETLNL